MEETIAALTLLAELKPGETISLHDKSVLMHSHWSTAFSRKYRGETRVKLMDWVEQHTDIGLDVAKEGQIKDKANMISLLKSVCLGLASLQVTYAGDSTLAHRCSAITGRIASIDTCRPIMDYDTDTEVPHNSCPCDGGDTHVDDVTCNSCPCDGGNTHVDDVTCNSCPCDDAHPERPLSKRTLITNQLASAMSKVAQAVELLYDL